MPIQLTKPIVVQADAGLAQPVRQGREDQQERQAGREAQEQERDDARMRVDRERLAPASGVGAGALKSGP